MPIGQQFAGYARAYHFDLAVFDTVPKSAADFRHHHLLRRVASGLLRDADLDVGRITNLLKLNLSEA